MERNYTRYLFVLLFFFASQISFAQSYISVSPSSGCAGAEVMTTGSVNPYPAGEEMYVYLSTTEFGSPIGSFGLCACQFGDGPELGIVPNVPPGTYYVQLTNTITIYAISSFTVTGPSAAITPSGAVSLCQGNSLTLYAIGAGTSYQWSLNGSQIGGATGNSYTTSQAGNYSLKITESGCGPATSSATTVSVISSPTASITAGGPTTFCSGDSVTLTADSAYSYLWSTGDTTRSIDVNQSGNYTVNVIAQNTCSATSSPQTVLADTVPPPQITANGATTFCDGDSVMLSTGAQNNYLWSNSATTQSISVKQTGSFTVTVSDVNHCSATSTATPVTVNSLPNAGITAGSSTTFCAGDSVSLLAVETNSYLWSNSATTQSIQVLQSGNYSVTVTDSNSCSATSSVIAVTVNTLPPASITPASATTFCQGDSVILTAGTGSWYVWSNSATGQTLIVKQSGNLTVAVTDSNNCSASSAVTTVTVNPLPLANIAAGGATTFCMGDSVTLTADTAIGYLWSNGITAQSISANAAANYSLIASTAYNCTAQSNIITITVDSLPAAIIDAGGPVTFCAGNNVLLTAGAGVAYLWSNNATTQSIQVTQSGSFTVTVSNVNSCSAASAATVVTVNALPDATIVPASANFCIGGHVLLTASGGISYVWSNSANNPSTLVNPTQTTVFTVAVTGNNGCIDSANATITVYQLPDTNITPPGEVAVCNGDSVALAAAPGNPTYVWNTGQTTQTIEVKYAGNYQVSITSVNNCTVVSNAVSVTVNALPVAPTISQTGDTLTSSIAAAYQWYRNNDRLNAGSAQQLVISQSGAYQVEITDNNGCKNSSAVLNATATGITASNMVDGLKLYPNPNKGNFTLEFADVSEKEIEITDVTGKVIVPFIKMNRQKNFDLNTLTSGIYFLQIMQGGAERSIKFSVVK